MYNSYFGFSESPFENDLDQRFLYFSANHRDAAAALLNFIKWKKGVALLCGEAGTGKTLLIHYLLSRLPDSVRPVMLTNPDDGYVDILRSVAGIFKIDDPGISVPDLADHVKSALDEAGRREERYVLIVDAAHLISDQCIEEIRLLSNIETLEHNLFQILFVGQCALSDRLNRPEMSQLRQRISINRFLAPMNAAETIHYIDHRLNVAGAGFDACFEPHCRQLIFKITGGIPCRINQLCDRALRVCMTEKLLKVDRKILKQVGMELRRDVLYTTGLRSGSAVFPLKTTRLPAVFGGAAIIWILLVIYGYQGGLGEKAQYFLHGIQPLMSTPPAALQQPISEPAASKQMPSGAIIPDAADVAKPPDPMSDAALQIAGSGSTPPPSGTTLPEMNQILPAEVPESPMGKAEKVVISPLQRIISFSAENQASRLSRQKSIVVKNGDTLIRIASRYFPENTRDGVKIILAANPKIDDINRIYPGQKLIIPETGSDYKDLNSR